MNVPKSSSAYSRCRLFLKSNLRVTAGLLLAATLGLGAAFSPLSRLLSGSAAAQGDRIGESALRQIEALMREKESRTPEQKKIDSQLLYKLKQKRGEPIAPGLENLGAGVQEVVDGAPLLDIRAKVTPEVLEAIRQAGGEIVYAYEQYNEIRARLSLDALEAIAGLNEVRFIRPAEEPMINGNSAKRPTAAGNGGAGVAPRPTRAERAARVRDRLRQTLPTIARRKNHLGHPGFSSGGLNIFPAFIGALDSEGDVAHRADQVRALGINGNGVRIGVLSDSVRFLAQSQASADLPAVVTVLAGQDGLTGTDTGEGTAMLEIIHDLAPGAQLFFATGFGGPANMAANIQALAANPNNCDIIVDDLTYFAEGVFQDDVIARAVNTVTAAGVLYFSSAGNSGNLSDGTTGVWEGDFADGGTLAAVGGGRVHDFGGAVVGNAITGLPARGTPITIKWSDPLGQSGNDYDLFVLDPTLTTVRASSTNTQDGDDNPFESVANPMTGPLTINVGDRVVILRRTGAATRALHLNTNRGRLAIGTAGQTYGHNAAGSAFGVGQVDVATAGGGVFTGGAANPVRITSSDGPRRIFFDPNGNALTPGNVLFGSGGGQLLQKPDIAAAACNVTTVPGFNPFCGTSAAAPHAAAIAGLLLSFNNALTPAQIRAALTSTALDIEAVGTDRDSGAGIVMALQAIGAVSSADLAITKTDSPDPVVTGTNLTYTINVSNNGAGPAVFAQWQDTLPAGTRLQSFSGAAGWNCVTPPVGSGGTITCRKDTMAVSESASFIIETTVNCSLPDGAVINNTATISATTADPNPANNSASTTTVASNPPPVIVCPPDRDIIATKPGNQTAVVTFPDPMVTDNCPGVTVVCNPPSGSAFPLGVTTVNCTATDSGGGTASCGFKVTVWDASVQDDEHKDFVLFNTYTGDYKFTHCGPDAFVMTGKGVITRVDCTTKLQDDSKVLSASFNRCLIAPVNTGEAEIKRLMLGYIFTLKDRNILNNSPTCP